MNLWYKGTHGIINHEVIVSTVCGIIHDGFQFGCRKMPLEMHSCRGNWLWFNELKCCQGRHGMIEYLVTVWTGYDICRRLDDEGRLRIGRSRRRRRRWSIYWFYACGWTVLSTRVAHIWYGRPDFLDVQCTSGAFIPRWQTQGCEKYCYCIIGPGSSTNGCYWNCVRRCWVEDSR